MDAYSIDIIESVLNSTLSEEETKFSSQTIKILFLGDSTNNTIFAAVVYIFDETLNPGWMQQTKAQSVLYNSLRQSQTEKTLFSLK